MLADVGRIKTSKTFPSLCRATMETSISHLETTARVQTIDYHGKIQVYWRIGKKILISNIHVIESNKIGNYYDVKSQGLTIHIYVISRSAFGVSNF